jgi:hypothetical protein
MELTPKEKAKELVDKFQYAKNYRNSSNAMSESLAKQCALIAVDEIINYLISNSITGTLTTYWKEVKTEINNL